MYHRNFRILLPHFTTSISLNNNRLYVSFHNLPFTNQSTTGEATGCVSVWGLVVCVSLTLFQMGSGPLV